MIEQLSRHVVHDLWDLKDRSIRMRCYRDLLNSQWLAREDQQQRQLRALRTIVSYARNNVPWYREHYSDLPEILSSPTELPILEKQHVQENVEQLISEEFDANELVEARTGGSTGKPLRVLFDLKTQERRNAAQARSNDWAGAHLGMAQVALWGNPKVDNSFKARMRHHLLDRLSYVDTVGFDENSAQEFVDQWISQNARVIFGHAHSIYLLAQYLQRNDERRIRPAGIISTSMSLLSGQRALIEEVFGCPVTDRYGCEEVGLIAAQCEQHDYFHINTDHVFVEIVNDADQPCSPGEPGQILVTDLTNRGMPLIRYRVGDTATFTDAICECGRESPLLEKLGGRLADFLLTRERAHVAGISLIERTLTVIPGLDQMQIIQEEIDQFTINYVKAKNFAPDCLAKIKAEFEVVFGTGISIDFSEKTVIPQLESGKYRFSICNVKDSE
jgi:phenylacetate-CoA ligase